MNTIITMHCFTPPRQCVKFIFAHFYSSLWEALMIAEWHFNLNFKRFRYFFPLCCFCLHYFHFPPFLFPCFCHHSIDATYPGNYITHLNLFVSFFCIFYAYKSHERLIKAVDMPKKRIASWFLLFRSLFEHFFICANERI